MREAFQTENTLGPGDVRACCGAPSALAPSLHQPQGRRGWPCRKVVAAENGRARGGIPHARGGVSQDARHPVLLRVSSPRMWG